MKNKILLSTVLVIGLLFGSTIKGFSQQHTFQSLPSSSKKTSISGESIKINGIGRTLRGGNTYIENNRKKKKIKTKIRILHSDSCPSFAAYTSKPKERREKLLRKKRG